MPKTDNETTAILVRTLMERVTADILIIGDDLVYIRIQDGRELLTTSERIYELESRRGQLHELCVALQEYLEAITR